MGLASRRSRMRAILGLTALLPLLLLPNPAAGPLHETADASNDPSTIALTPPASGPLANGGGPTPVEAGGFEARGTDDPAFAVVAQEIERSVRARGWRDSRWGILAVSGETGDTLVARDVHEPLAPASNVKILTSAAALFHLGADSRFPTLVLADEPVTEGVLQGDLVLYGTGDPALSDRFFDSDLEPFQKLARKLAEQGVERVAGDVVGDGTFLPGPPIPSTWDDTHLTARYGAPASALSANDNLITLRISPADEAGEPPVVETEPEGAKVRVDVRATTVAQPSRPMAVERPDRDGPIEISGEIHLQARDQWRRIPVTDPPLLTASLFREALKGEGIQVDGEVRSSAPGDAAVARGSLSAPAFERRGGPRVLAIHRSPPVEELLSMVNGRSNNLYAELLLRAVGQAAHGDGSFPGGVEAVEAYLSRRVGADSDAFHLADGSGLSRENRASAAGILEVLQHIDRQPYADAFWGSMPIAGDSRDLRRMGGTAAAGNLQAKTGTIRNVSALSGRVRTGDGEPVYFSIVANDVPSSWGAKDVEDRIGERLAAFRRQNGPVRTAGGTEEGSGTVAASEGEEAGGR